MKKYIFLLLMLLSITLAGFSQYSPIVYGTLANDDYTTVNRKYFTVPTSALNDGQAHLMSLMEISREMARAAAGVGIYASPAISSTPATYTPSTLVNPNFTGGFTPPNPRFKISKVLYSPVPCNGKNLRMVIVRPNDNVVRPCIMVTNPKSGDMAHYLQFLFNGADYLMRGYVVAYYENSEAKGVELISNLDCGAGFWPGFQTAIYQGFQYAVAATKFMKGNASLFGVDNTKFFASGMSFGSMCSMMLTFADAGNFNHASFAEPGGGVNFNAKTYPSYHGQVVTDIKAVAPIATGIPLPGAGNNIGNIFDAGDNGTSVIFIHGRKDTLFNLATMTAPYAPVTDYPSRCTQAGVKVETLLALRTRMNGFGIQSKALIHCDAEHATIALAIPLDANFFADPFLSNIDFDVTPNSTFVTKNQEWMAMVYNISQTSCYSNVISQQFRAKIAAYTPLRPSSPDGVDGVRPMNPQFFWPLFVNGIPQLSSCGYNDGSVSFKGMDATDLDVQPEGFVLAPNPSNGLVTLRLPQAADAAMAVEVVNLQGVRVHATRLSSGQVEAALDLQHLPAAIYLVRAIQADGNCLMQKLVKE